MTEREHETSRLMTASFFLLIHDVFTINTLLKYTMPQKFSWGGRNYQNYSEKPTLGWTPPTLTVVPGGRGFAVGFRSPGPARAAPPVPGPPSLP